MAEASIRPATFAQKRLWFVEQLDPGSATYNLCRMMRITGPFAAGAFEKALNAIAARHETLRTTFTVVDGEPFLSVHSAGSTSALPDVSTDELSYGAQDLTPEQRLDSALTIAGEEGRRQFDLTAGPLWRARLVRFSPEEHFLILTFHHSITDGWSMSVFFNELGELYCAFLSGDAPNLPELTIHYSDFARWQQESSSNGVLERELEYWERNLRGIPGLLDLPADRPRPAVQAHSGRQHKAVLDAQLAGRIHSLSVSAGVTPFMTLLTAFQTLLWRYTQSETFVVGTPLAGRNEVELEQLIGLFSNTLPLRADVSGDLSFRELLERVRHSTLEAFSHQDVPLEAIVERLRPERSLAYTPLFQVMFLFQNIPPVSQKFSGTQLEEIVFDPGIAKFDLTLEVYEGEGLYCTWEYRTDLFNQERIARMADHFEVLLREAVADPGRRISELPILTGAERRQLLADWNATHAEYPRETCIHEAFEQRAAECQEAPAVLSAERDVTFGQLNSEANALAHYLHRLGVRTHTRVGIFMERSADAIVAILAVLKAGASYVPIDAAYPEKRVAFLLADSQVSVLIAHRSLRTRISDFGGNIVYLDQQLPAILSEKKCNLGAPVRAADPAYVMYTSGSTGTPKGVVATHRASMNRFAWMWRTYPFGRDETCAQRTSLGFVDSVWEILGPLLAGVPISIVADDTVRDPERLVQHLASYNTTRVVLVPSLIESLLESGSDLKNRLPHLRLCVSSGEALSSRLYERFQAALPAVKVLNLYGSSEVAADATCFDTAQAKAIDVLPIGRPISNVRVYILDKYLHPAPIGVPGEIHVAGDSLAAGYLGMPELTADRFMTIKLGDGITERVYKTGDLGRYRENGDIEFLGRADRQIKIRGMRIELEEIEAVLTSHPSVHQSAVIAKDSSTTADRRLVSYLTAANGQVIVESDLRRYLRGRLPEPMIPSAFVTLPQLPLNSNGKIDQLALPSPESIQSDAQREYQAPRNPIEEKLREIWSEVLGCERIGIHDNFFELGGHSLTAVRVLARIRRALGVEIPVRSMFEGPTISALAAGVENARANGVIARVPDFGQRPVAQAREELLARMRDLSDEQVHALLKTVLGSRLQGSNAL